MAEQIEDGTGTGNRVKVNSANQLITASEVVPEITHISSVEAGASQFHFKRTVIAGNTLENVFIITYNGESQLQVDSIIFSREDVALASSGQAHLELYSNISYTSGGDAIIPKNVNLSSSRLLVATSYSGSTTLVLNTTSKEEIIDVTISDAYAHEFKGALILKKGDSIAAIGKSLNIGDTIHAIVFAYEVTEVI